MKINVRHLAARISLSLVNCRPPSWRWAGLGIAWGTFIPVAMADEEGLHGMGEQHKAASVRLYRTREEQREAGLKREITPWLTISGLAEGELLYLDYDALAGEATDSGIDKSANLQLGMEAALFDVATAEIIFEYDTEERKILTDEALLSLEKGEWELTLGKMYTPFGVFFSSFVTSPVIEFGETQADAVALVSYEPDDNLEISLGLYKGVARQKNKAGEEWSWVLGAEFWLHDGLSFGASVQSDLADSDAGFLEENDNRYDGQTPAVSGFILWVGESYEVSLEGLAAIGSFEELESDRNKPAAWNAEMVRFFTGADFEFALRFEGSREVEDEPRYQYGAAATWRAGKYASLTMEFLHGEFDGDLAVTGDDKPYDHVNRVGAILSVEF